MFQWEPSLVLAAHLSLRHQQQKVFTATISLSHTLSPSSLWYGLSEHEGDDGDDSGSDVGRHNGGLGAGVPAGVHPGQYSALPSTPTLDIAFSTHTLNSVPQQPTLAYIHPRHHVAWRWPIRPQALVKSMRRELLTLPHARRS